MAKSYSLKAILSASDRGFSSAFKSAQSSVERLKSTLTSGLGFGIMTGIGQKAFSAITSGISGVTGELNESSAAWKTFNGNMRMIGKGTKSITKTRDELQDFATKTIYSASDMATTYSQLAAVGTKNCTKLVKGFGGLAAASENPTQAMKTLSQQATQAAAKPTIQWMDFKLMLEQTPAGIAAVAKGMGKTTSQLVQDVQDGKVKTEDFFNAIAKVGTSKSFTKLATSYKTAGQAMDGLKETLGVKLMPTFNKASDVAISGIEKVIGRLDKVDPDGLAKKVESAVSVVSPYWKAFSDATSKAGKAIINAVSAVGKSFGGLAQKKSSLDTFTSVVSGISDAIAHFAQIVADHSDEIASAAPKILKLLLAIKGFKIIQSLVPGVTTFASALLKIGGKGIAALAGKLFGVAAGEKAVGTASKESFGSLGSVCYGIPENGSRNRTGCSRICVAYAVCDQSCKSWSFSCRCHAWNGCCNRRAAGRCERSCTDFNCRGSRIHSLWCSSCSGRCRDVIAYNSSNEAGICPDRWQLVRWSAW